MSQNETSTGELYLILHKVRGEPAFDIAYMMEIGDEVGWLIPTSGHRAYPFVQVKLTDINAFMIDKMHDGIGSADWDSLEDHYTILDVTRGKEHKAELAQRAKRLLDKLGLRKKQPSIGLRPL